jgi:HPt (histidine-containing phosphotransfer) domain-containing protein
MSKMSELDLVMRDFHEACDAVIASCKEVMAQCEAILGRNEPDSKEVEPLTLEWVRGVLADKSRAGFTAEVLHQLHQGARGLGVHFRLYG